MEIKSRKTTLLDKIRKRTKALADAMAAPSGASQVSHRGADADLGEHEPRPRDDARPTPLTERPTRVDMDQSPTIANVLNHREGIAAEGQETDPSTDSADDRKKSQSISLAVDYYETHKPLNRSVTLEGVAKMFGVSKRSICRHREERKNGPKPRKLRASFERIPPDLRVVALAISNVWRLKGTTRGKMVVRRLKARLLEATAEIMSQPELQPAWLDEYPDD